MGNLIEHEEISDYDPNRLLDVLRDNLKVKNDAAHSRMLEVGPPVISKIRHRKLPVGAALLIRMHEVTGLNIIDLRYLMGDRRGKFRISDVEGRRKMDDIRVATCAASVNAAIA